MLPATLIAAADAALYRAKSLGRDRVTLHSLGSQLQFHN
jgi:PleD family two-component response regulator